MNHPSVSGLTVLKSEMMYFEYMRGQRGVPLLYGGWFEDNQLFYVVQHAGWPIGLGKGSAESPYVLGREYEAFARWSPLGAATALLRCFESFSQRGGYFLLDFKPEQFSITLPPPGASETEVEIFLVDGPDALEDPVASFLRESGLWDHISHTIETNATCKQDTDCRDVHGKREGKGTCDLQGPGQEGVCRALTSKKHVSDVAANPWALPSILQAAKDTSNHAAERLLTDLIERMLVDPPSDRPTFSEAIAGLETAKRHPLSNFIFQEERLTGTAGKQRKVKHTPFPVSSRTSGEKKKIGLK